MGVVSAKIYTTTQKMELQIMPTATCIFYKREPPSKLRII